MVIELDETKWSPTMAARITRPRAVKILALIAEAREVIIQTHPEPEILRVTYTSEWFKALVRSQPEIIDPNGIIQFLQKIDDLFTELGLDEGETAETAEPNGFEHPVYGGETIEGNGDGQV